VQRQSPQVTPIEVKQVESDHHDLGGPPLEFILQNREVGGAIGRGNLSKAVRPVIAATGKNLHRRVSEMNLSAVAVELDLVDPPRAGWDPIDRRRQLGFDEPRIRRLDADRRGVFALERHTLTHATKLGFKPSSVRDAAGDATVTRSFDPGAEETLFYPRLVGG
jgi:hypothetical protein